MVEYRPEEVSYEQLLGVFWRSHEASYAFTSRQQTAYKSVLWYTTPTQQQANAAAIAAKQADAGRHVYTENRNNTQLKFWSAEVYHQRYYEFRDPRC